MALMLKVRNEEEDGSLLNPWLEEVSPGVCVEARDEEDDVRVLLDCMPRHT
jgi:hypothetical protein